MSSKIREVIYFEEGGAQNTDLTLQTAVKTLDAEDLSFLVVASGGDTLLKTAELLDRQQMKGITLIGVTLQAGRWPKYSEPDFEKLRAAERLGAKVLTCTHSLLGNVEAAIREKFGGLPPVELIAHTYYTLSQGTKVAVEITMNAVDAGLVPAGEEMVAVAGSGGGADTALLIKSASTVDFFDLRIKEILCKPLE